MNKNIIKIVVIVIAFSASGLVLYFGMFKGAGNSGPHPLSPIAASGSIGLGGVAGLGGASPAFNEAILPKGDSLDFSKIIDRKRFNYDIVIYPKLNPATDVGIDLNLLVVPPVGNGGQ